MQRLKRNATKMAETQTDRIASNYPPKKSWWNLENMRTRQSHLYAPQNRRKALIDCIKNDLPGTAPHLFLPTLAL